MKTRMQPVGLPWAKLPRVVRDLAAEFGKNIRLERKAPPPSSIARCST